MSEQRSNDYWTGYAQGMSSGIEQGQRDALAAAVQRVEALYEQASAGRYDARRVRLLEVIAAIKGEQ